MNIFISNLYLFFLAFILALLEIQIEGENGWAKNLPTWRPRVNSWYDKIFKKIKEVISKPSFVVKFHNFERKL